MVARLLGGICPRGLSLETRDFIAQTPALDVNPIHAQFQHRRSENILVHRSDVRLAKVCVEFPSDRPRRHQGEGELHRPSQYHE
jgi:hypothetical protein